MSAYSVEDIRTIEQYCIEQLRIPEHELMARAGKQAWQLLQQQWPAAQHITVLCGPGNNGGDGYVLARLAQLNGYEVQVYVANESPPGTPVSLDTYQQYQAVGGKISVWEQQLEATDIIVDALFGIGLQRPIKGIYADMIKIVNKSKTPILALDIPSGLNADSGMCLSETIEADITATFIAEKDGLLKAKSNTGEVILCDLNLPSQVLANIAKSNK